MGGRDSGVEGGTTFGSRRISSAGGLCDEFGLRVRATKRTRREVAVVLGTVQHDGHSGETGWRRRPVLRSLGPGGRKFRVRRVECFPAQYHLNSQRICRRYHPVLCCRSSILPKRSVVCLECGGGRGCAEQLSFVYPGRRQTVKSTRLEQRCVVCEEGGRRDEMWKSRERAKGRGVVCCRIVRR